VHIITVALHGVARGDFRAAEGNTRILRRVVFGEEDSRIFQIPDKFYGPVSSRAGKGG